MKAEREAGKSYSSYGFELGFIVPDQCDWPVDALYEFVTHITDGVEIKWGDRFAFGFTEQPGGALGGFTGHPEQLGVTPFGNIRAVLFWRYLFPDWEFLTSTGKFMVLVATGITQREWQVAKETTTVHLLMLLCRSGSGRERSSIEDACWTIHVGWMNGTRLKRAIRRIATGNWKPGSASGIWRSRQVKYNQRLKLTGAAIPWFPERQRPAGKTRGKISSYRLTAVSFTHAFRAAAIKGPIDDRRSMCQELNRFVRTAIDWLMTVEMP